MFTFDGATEHELWRVYEGTIVEDWPYERDTFTWVEPELGEEHPAHWISLERLRGEDTTFYAPAVLDALVD